MKTQDIIDEVIERSVRDAAANGWGLPTAGMVVWNTLEVLEEAGLLELDRSS